MIMLQLVLQLLWSHHIISFIAEQISSVVTVIDESTISFVNLNVFEPIFFTATPSAKIPTCFNELVFHFYKLN